MELEEAKLYLEHTGEDDFNLEKYQAQNRKEAIETVLQALDNSISKDKVKEKIEKIKENTANIGLFVDAELMNRADAKVQVLKELLEDK